MRSPEALDGDQSGLDFAPLQNSREKLKIFKYIAVFVPIKAYILAVLAGRSLSMGKQSKLKLLFGISANLTWFKVFGPAAFTTLQLSFF